MLNNLFIRQIFVELRYMYSTTPVFIIFVLAPIFYSFFYAFPYIDEVPRNVPVALIDQDHTNLSRKFAQMLDTSENINIFVSPPSMEDAKGYFYDRKVYAVILIPAGFEKSLLRNEQAGVPLYTDGSYLLYHKQVYAAAQMVASTLGAGIAIARFEGVGLPEKVANQLYTAVAINDYPLFNPAGGYATYVLPAVFVLILHQIMLVTIGMTMGYQRRNPAYLTEAGGADRPVTPLARLGAKLVVNSGVMYVQIMLLFAVVLSLFDITFTGRMGDIALFMFPFMLSVIFLGIITGSFIKEPELAILYIAVFSIPLLFLSGVPWSVSDMPLFVRWLGALMPSSQGMKGIVSIYREGATLAEVSPMFWTLWVKSLILCPLALWRLKSVGAGQFTAQNSFGGSDE